MNYGFVLRQRFLCIRYASQEHMKKKKSKTSFSALSLTNLSLFCMRKGYQKVLSKDIGTQFNLVPPFPPVCPSPSLSLSFGVKTVIEMSHFTDNAYRGKRYFSITTTRKEEFSLTQFFLFIPYSDRIGLCSCKLILLWF